MLNPEQVSLLIELMEEVEKSGFKSETLVVLSKSHLFKDTLVDLKQMNYDNRSDEEPE